MILERCRYCSGLRENRVEIDRSKKFYLTKSETKMIDKVNAPGE